MTQQQADLIHWISVRDTTTSWTEWRLAQGRIDTLFRAMGHPPSPLAHLADKELIFPAVREALGGEP